MYSNEKLCWGVGGIKSLLDLTWTTVAQSHAKIRIIKKGDRVQKHIILEVKKNGNQINRPTEATYKRA